jgi:hypothetical protein
MTPDMANGIFEFGGSCFLLLHVLKIMKDKQARGVAKLPFFWFASWGYFNCLFYPWAGLWWSFVGGVPVVLVNTWYCVLLWKYRNN